MRLDLVVGPNGAGKSTFVRLTLAPVLPRASFVNADLIAQQRWPDDAEAHSYEAARIAAATREALIARREPFIAETVFSHPSKLDLLREAGAAGYYTALHVVMVPEELAVARVAARVAAGGHARPRGEDPRALPPALAAGGRCDRAGRHRHRLRQLATRTGPRVVADFSHGFVGREPAMAGLDSRGAHRPLAPRRRRRADRRSRARPSDRRPGGRRARAPAGACPCRSSSRQTCTAVMPSRRGPRTSGSHESPTKTTSAGSTPKRRRRARRCRGAACATRPGPR